MVHISHAIHKQPMIRRGVAPRQSLIDNQIVTAATATPDQLDLGLLRRRAAESLLGPTTYARVDMVREAGGRPALLELELLDPVLFLTTAPGSAERFAAVLTDTLPDARRTRSNSGRSRLGTCQIQHAFAA